MARLIVLFCITLLAACSATSGRQEESTEPQGRVRDFASIIEPATEQRLTKRLDEAQSRYGPQVGVVTVPSLERFDIADYSLEYARKWKLGDTHRNDGLMIMVAPNERQVRIEVGYGLEGSFSDPFCKEIIEKTMLPQFRQGNYDRGLESAIDIIVAKMKAVPTLPANDNAVSSAEKSA